MYLINILTKNSTGPGGFSGEFYQMARKTLIRIPHRLFLKREVEETLPDSFCEASIILIPKSEKKTLQEKDTMEIRNQHLKISKELAHRILIDS